jgi:type II secretory pathway pseudopilin PulG
MDRIAPHKQQGISLVGLIFVLAILGFVGVLGLKIVPTYIEYRAISNGIKQAKAAGTTVRAIQDAFNQNASVTYIESISGKDLIIGAENGEIEVSFAYEKRIPLMGPASLVLDYTGTTAKGGVPAVKPAE